MASVTETASIRGRGCAGDGLRASPGQGCGGPFDVSVVGRVGGLLKMG